MKSNMYEKGKGYDIATPLKEYSIKPKYPP